MWEAVGSRSSVIGRGKATRDEPRNISDAIGIIVEGLNEIYTFECDLNIAEVSLIVRSHRHCALDSVPCCVNRLRILYCNGEFGSTGSCGKPLHD